MRVATVVGARPQFVKAASVSRALRSQSGMTEVLIHTGQHYDENMSDIFFSELELPRPDHWLGVGSANHGAQTGRMLEAVENVLLNTRPEWVLVYGDTNSTLAGALAAAKLHMPVAHVEAGLRSYNRRMPEEINRVLTDHISDLLLAPTQQAADNLISEGIEGALVQRVGDVMYDAALYCAGKAEERSSVLNRLGLGPRSYALATVHRAENTDDPSRLHQIFDALAHLSSELPVVVPLHPRTRQRLHGGRKLSARGQRLLLVEPLGYLDMVMLEKNALVIATDSGGVQKEAYFYRVPCVTLRDETEWVELVAAGWNHLVSPSDPAFGERFVETTRRLRTPESWEPFYGDGRASQRIAGLLLAGPANKSSRSSPISVDLPPRSA